MPAPRGRPIVITSAPDGRGRRVRAAAAAGREPKLLQAVVSVSSFLGESQEVDLGDGGVLFPVDADDDPGLTMYVLLGDVVLQLLVDGDVTPDQAIPAMEALLGELPA